MGKPRFDMWGNEIPERRWTDGLKSSYEKDPESGRVLFTVWRDESGEVVRRVRWPRPYVWTDCPYSRTEQPREYAAWYYRNRRRHADGRTPILPDFE